MSDVAIMKKPNLLLKHIIPYNTALTTLVLGSLLYNAEMWIGDYPPGIQEKFGTPSPKSQQQAKILAIPFIFISLGGIIYSLRRLKQLNNGNLPFSAAFPHATGLMLSFWLFDLTILDWFIFVKMTPSFVVLPGTDGMAGYDDYMFHLKEHMRAFPFIILAGAIVAWIAAKLSSRE